LDPSNFSFAPRTSHLTLHTSHFIPSDHERIDHHTTPRFSACRSTSHILLLLLDYQPTHSFELPSFAPFSFLCSSAVISSLWLLLIPTSRLQITLLREVVELSCSKEFSHLQLKRLTTTDQLSRLSYTAFALLSSYSIPRRSIESTSIFCEL
jgi:hypothetical protein